MRRLSAQQTIYYMVRFELFRSIKNISDELEVSYTTVKRWSEGRVGAPRYLEPALEKYLKGLVDGLRQEAKKGPIHAFYEDIADALIADPVPGWTKPIIMQKDIQELKDYLINELTGNSRRSSKVMKAAEEMGYSRGRVYQVADELGVYKRVVKPGRGGYSIWSLPAKSRKRDRS